MSAPQTPQTIRLDFDVTAYGESDMGTPFNKSYTLFIAREFFRLLMMEIESNAALMCGMEGRRKAVHNTVALDNHEFRTIGQCISLSIIYGRTGPHFFSETAACYLIGLPITNVPKKDIPHHTK